MRRVTVTITDKEFDVAKRQADESGMTVAQWIVWLVATYEPPTEDRDA